MGNYLSDGPLPSCVSSGDKRIWVWGDVGLSKSGCGENWLEKGLRNRHFIPTLLMVTHPSKDGLKLPGLCVVTVD